MTVENAQNSSFSLHFSSLRREDSYSDHTVTSLWYNVIHIASLYSTLSPCDSLSMSEYSASCSFIAFYVILHKLPYPSIPKMPQPCIRPIFPIRTKLFPCRVMSHHVMPCILCHVTLSGGKFAVQYKVCNV